MHNLLLKMAIITRPLWRGLWMVAAFNFILILVELVSFNAILAFLKGLVDGSFSGFPFNAMPEYLAPGTNKVMAFKVWAPLILLVFFLKSVVNFQLQRLIISFNKNVQVFVREALVTAQLHAPVAQTFRQDLAQNITLCLSHTNLFSKAIVGSLIKLFCDGVLSAALLCFLFYTVEKRALVVALCLVLIILVFDGFYKKAVRKHGKTVNRSHESMVGALREAFDALMESKVLKKNAYFEEKIFRSSRNYAEENARFTIIQALPKNIIEFSMVLLVLAFTAVNLIVNDDLNLVISEVLIFALVGVRLMPLSSQMITNLNSLRFVTNVVDEIYQQLTFDNSAVIRDIEFKPPKLLELQLENISVSYDEPSSVVLNNVNFVAKSGEIVLVTGKSGEGKTTLLLTLIGALHPKHGNGLINSRAVPWDLWHFHLTSFYMGQSPAVINGSIFQNVALGELENEIDADRVRYAIDKVGLGLELSKYLDDPTLKLSDSRAKVSGGQRQRLALARAIYFDRDLVILDEPTAALDKQNSQKISRLISEIFLDKTVIIVTHVPELFENASRHYQLVNGSVKLLPR